MRVPSATRGGTVGQPSTASSGGAGEAEEMEGEEICDPGGDGDEGEDDMDDTLCERCGEGDDEANFLLCEDCPKGYHIYCLRPKLPRVPKARLPADDGKKTRNYVVCFYCLFLSLLNATRPTKDDDP